MLKKSITLQLVGFILLLISIGACRKIDQESFIPKQPDISFTQLGATVVNEGDTIEVAIESNLPWRLKTDANWISFLTTNGQGSETVKVVVQKNRTTSQREANIIAYVTEDYFAEFSLVQSAGDPPPDYTRDFYVKEDGLETNTGLAWNLATTLDVALDNAASGDIIHVAAGTYKPGVTITGGSNADDADKTFEIIRNVTLIGGYPAQATVGAVANPKLNETILSGQVSSGKVYHVVSVTAPLEVDEIVTIDGFTIKDGSAKSSSSSITINGIGVNRGYAGGMVVAGSKVEVKNTQISNNQTGTHCAGVFLTGNSYVTFRNSIISDNIGLSATSNGGGIWNDGSTLYMYDSEVTGNRTGGVGGGIYSLNNGRTSFNYLFNVTIADNAVGSTGNTSRTGAGIYAREKSKFVIVNTTIYRNNNNGTSFGAGITLYGLCTVDLINSTVSKNEGGTGSTSSLGGAGIYNNPSHANSLNIYNSIVSGNEGSSIDVGGNNNPISSAIGSEVFDYNGNLVIGKTFDATTSFRAFANYGGFGKTIPLVDDINVASQSGMSNLQLQVLAANLTLESDLLTVDQNNKSRASKTAMGASLSQ